MAAARGAADRQTLTIHGFKSFRDAVAVDPFSAHHNVVVGRNGSGKSNFFAAVRFVLGNAYTSMTREERQALLYDSSGATSATLSAYVEIVFDNTDARFPTSGDEVVLRRTVSAAKDEFMIDRKVATRAEVGNLLESAGFSRSNPYYIVPQGKIAHITNASDGERLALLKEVAGTRVYEQRRDESVALQRSTQDKAHAITELLAQIDSRIAELGKEQGDLKKFHARDRERRCLEYTIYQRELADVAELLDAHEGDRRREVDQSNSRRAEFVQRDQTIARLEEQLAGAEQQLEQATLDRTQLEQERRELSRERAHLDSALEDLHDAEHGAADRRAHLEAQLEAVAAQLRAKDQALARESRTQQDALDALEQARGEYERTRARIAALYAKQGRAAQFPSQAARDEALEQQAEELAAFEATLRELQADTQRSVAAGEASLAQLGERRAALERRAEQRGHTLAQLGDAWRAAKQQRDELTERKKELWKSETKTDAALAHARDQLSAAQRALATTMDRATAAGIQAVEAIAQREQLHGVYGPLYQLFTVDERYKTAVEATAGAALFHIVVDTDATASRLLEHLGRERAGRVTLMPLNRLRPEPVSYPQAQDAVVMLRKLQFHEPLLPAFRQVFGKTIICPSLEVAGAYVRSAGVNAITLDGDQVHRRGTLSGGYHDPRRSRLDAVRAVQRWLGEVRAAEQALGETRTALGDLEQRVTQLYTEMHQLELRRQQLHDARAPEHDELTWVRRSEADTRSRLARLQRQDADRGVELAGVAERRAALLSEVGTPLASQLTAAEAGELEQLVAGEGAARERLAQLTRRSVELAERTSALSMEIDEHLLRTKGDVASRLEALADPLGAGGVSDSEMAAASVARQLEANAARLRAAEERADALAAEVRALEARLDGVRSSQSEQGGDMARQAKLTERFAAKKQRLLEQRERCHQQIRDLGVLPEDAFRSYAHQSTDTLVRQLQRAKAALAEVAHVNKRAVEQYDSFTRQRDALRQRHADLGASARSIDELLAVLDGRKAEAIERTFAQVAEHFADVFARLVPAGRGRLVLLRDGAQEPTGVAIEVVFDRRHGEPLRIHQLSGGQKSLVALATVFAIQKCDPAPFYLFDEIDANLDAQYRGAVARMVQELAQGAQFITTTFRPELVRAADKCYGVLFGANKVSSVEPIEQEQALQFVAAGEAAPTG